MKDYVKGVCCNSVTRILKKVTQFTHQEFLILTVRISLFFIHGDMIAIFYASFCLHKKVI